MSNVRPKQTVCIQMVRFVSAISTLILHAGYPLLKHHFQMAPLFVYIFPASTSKHIIAFVFVAYFIALLILTIATECIIFFCYVKKCAKKWEASKEAICAERKLAEEMRKTMDENGYSQAYSMEHFFKTSTKTG